MTQSDIQNFLYTYYSSFDAIEIIKRFTPHIVHPSEGQITNFLGVKMTPDAAPEFVRHLAGQVEAAPNPGNWHADIAEWASALWSVERAKETYQIIELGCGWGCWLNNMGVVAARKGLALKLIGVEGDRRHADDAANNIRLNGFNNDQWTVINGIAASRTGKSFFPVSENHSDEWGAEAVFFPSEDQEHKLRVGGRHLELDCHTLADISGGSVTDLLHIDIQGAELDFVRGSIGDMNLLVKRCLIGTHSRELDGALIGEFLRSGWKLEVERPAIHEIVDGYPETRIDGVQLWRNPSLTNNE